MRAFVATCLLLLAGCQLVGPSPDTDETPNTVAFDDSQLAATDRARYRETAAHLTVRYLDANPGHPAAREVVLPQRIWDAYYNLLLHLGESEAFAQTGAQHPGFLPDYDLRTVIVRVDTTQAWANALLRGTKPTGNARFDALARAYGLRSRTNAADFWGWLVVQADTLYNVRALLPALAQLPGVQLAEVNGYCCDGNRLLVEPDGDAWRVDYYVGGGDCPAGCTVWQRYVFTVSRSGDVRLVRTSSEAPPRIPIETRAALRPTEVSR